MQKFIDSIGNEWTLTLNLGAAKRVYDATGIDILNPVSFDDAGRVLSTRVVKEDLLLGNIIVAIIAPQAKKRGISEDELRELFDGETFVSASAVFFNEWSQFFFDRRKTWAGTSIRQDVEIWRETQKSFDARLSTELGGESKSSSGATESTITAG